MKDILTLHELVHYILKKEPEARNSDNYLYTLVLRDMGKKNGIDIDSMSITRFLLHLKEYGFPSIESVGRARRKVQQLHPELRSSDIVEAHKELNEEKYKEYGRRKW